MPKNQKFMISFSFENTRSAKPVETEMNHPTPLQPVQNSGTLQESVPGSDYCSMLSII